MDPYPKPLRDLIGALKRLPGIGEKTATRLALFILADRGNLPEELAATLKTGQHNHRRTGTDIVNPRIHRPHEFNQLVLNKLDHHLAGPKAFNDLSPDGSLLHIFTELLYYVIVNVCFEQGFTYISHSIGDVGLGDLAPAGKRPEYTVQFLR